jgi:hypothetical protein
MAHFAKLDQNNIVVTINVVHNNELLVDGVESEQKGINFLNNLFNTNDTWIQTSYNTNSGIHYAPNSHTPDDGFPLRKNYAGIGYTYDEDKDAFIPKKPYASWALNESTCQWEAPVAEPDDGKRYDWNEETTSWDLSE